MKTIVKCMIFVVSIALMSCFDSAKKDRSLKTQTSVPPPISFTVNKTEESISMTKTDLTSTLIIDQKERWQLISSSQSYNCNYAIYAKFTTEAADQSNYKKITKVEFKLLNYKGLIYMGLEDVCFFPLKNGIGAFVYLKAFGKFQGIDENPSNRLYATAKESTLSIENLEISVENGSIFWATKMLMPMHVIEKKDYDNIKDPSLKVKVEYQTCDFDEKMKMIYAKCSDGKTFDTEFFYKDGIYTMPKPVPETFKVEKDTLNKMLILAPDTRCRDSKLKIHFNTLSI